MKSCNDEKSNLSTSKKRIAKNNKKQIITKLLNISVGIAEFFALFVHKQEINTTILFKNVQRQCSTKRGRVRDIQQKE